MTIELLRDFFGWTALINYGFLLFWWFFFMFGKDFVYNLHTKWFPMTKEEFYRAHYILIAVYKLMIFIFALVPYIVCWILLD